jgi:small multidrug resistance pump
MNRNYLLLLAAIVAEVIATTALARSDGFTRLLPSLVAVVGYGIAFWCLATPLKTLPTGLVYAIWCGLGIVLITAVSWIRYRQVLDMPALLGLGLILGGVLVINLFSQSFKH